MTATTLTLEGVTKRFGGVAAVDAVSVVAQPGELLSLLGPSGCGKTTLLRLIAGFVLPDAGRIAVDGVDVSRLPAWQRQFGVVFQSYALFPHMTVGENVAYGLKVRGVARAARDERARATLDRVGLSGSEGRFPAQLSGGQQQRVALARAMVIEPRVLLLDEPLSALDKNLREEMQVELRLLQQRAGITTVFVTHDQEEALTLADRVAVMRAGRVAQVGTPRDVYDTPASAFVATFLGTTNLVPVEPGSTARLAVRPENVTLSATGPGLPGTVGDVLFQGHRLIVLFKVEGGTELRAFCRPGEFTLQKGDAAFATWDARHASLLEDKP
jgi:ABC-type Fe3+/spermidine/putrescine transport system ATPase subunit